MHNNDPDGSKKVKNIAAVIYLLVMIFVVGGSYLHQQADNSVNAEQQVRR